MLFLIIEEHSPDNCPAREGQGPHVLFEDVPGVEVRTAVADVPGHRLVFVVEAENYEALSAFVEPGRTRCTTSISPVTNLLNG